MTREQGRNKTKELGWSGRLHGVQTEKHEPRELYGSQMCDDANPIPDSGIINPNSVQV